MAVNVNAPHEVIRQLKDSGFTAEDLLGDVDVFLRAMQQTTAPNKQAQEARQELTRGLRAGGAPGTKSEAAAQIRELIYQHRVTVDLVNAAQSVGAAIKSQSPAEQVEAAIGLREAVKLAKSVRIQVKSHREAADKLEAHGNILESLIADLKASIASGNKPQQQTILDKIATATNEIQAAQVQKLAEDIQEVQTAVSGKLAILFKSGGPFLYPTMGPESYARMVAAGSKGKAVWALGLGPDKHPTYVKSNIDQKDVIDSQFASSSWVVAYYLVRRP